MNEPKKAPKALIELAQNLEVQSIFKHVLSPQGLAVKKLILSVHKGYFEENDASALLLELLTIAWMRNWQPNPSPEQKDFSDQDKKEILAGWVRELFSYPKNYVLRLELPSIHGLAESRLKIMSGVHLVHGNEMLTQRQEKPGSAQTNLANALMPVTEIQQTYLEVEIKGYADSDINSLGMSAALSKARQCLYVLSARGLLTWQYEYLAPSPRAEVESVTNGVTTDIRLPTSTASLLRYHTLNLDRLRLPDDNAPTLLGQVQGRSPEGAEEICKAFLFGLKEAASYLATISDPDFECVAAAIDWFYDCQFGDNQTVAYLAGCIGLESILGAEESMSELSSRLCDRYAFLLGKNKNERKAMSEEYKKILNLRGQLVHAKKPRLPGDQKDALFKVRSMLDKVIWHEICNIRNYRLQG